MPLPEGATFADGMPNREIVPLMISCKWFVWQGARSWQPLALRVDSALGMQGSRDTEAFAPGRLLLILPEERDAEEEAYTALLERVQSVPGKACPGLFDLPAESGALSWLIHGEKTPRW